MDAKEIRRYDEIILQLGRQALQVSLGCRGPRSFLPCLTFRLPASARSFFDLAPMAAWASLLARPRLLDGVRRALWHPRVAPGRLPGRPCETSLGRSCDRRKTTNRAVPYGIDYRPYHFWFPGGYRVRVPVPLG